jgi:hypothetical protein
MGNPLCLSFKRTSRAEQIHCQLETNINLEKTILLTARYLPNFYTYFVHIAVCTNINALIKGLAGSE